MTELLRQASLQSESSQTLDPKDWGDTRALAHRMLDDMIGYLQALSHLDTLTPAKALTMPVLFVWGEQPLRAATAAELRGLIPHSQFVQVPGSGHFVQLEAPGGFNQALEQFESGLR